MIVRQLFFLLSNMKKMRLLALAAAALMTFACGKVDKNLVAKMQADTGALGAYISEMSAIDTAANALLTQVDNAPQAIQATEQYVAVRERASALCAKLQASLAQLTDAQVQLADLIAAYSAGKTDTENAQKEYDLISGNYQNIGPLNARLKEMVGEIGAEFSGLAPAAGQ